MDPNRPNSMRSGRDPDDSPQLSSDLRNLYRPMQPIPDALRREVMHQAKIGLGNVRRSWRWGGLGVVAAAAMVIFGFQFLLQQLAKPDRSPSTTTPQQIAKRNDIDGNGRIDILDAFALAKRVEGNSKIDPAWDFNADGAVDRKDVDAVAQIAVQLNGGA